jgi:phage-related protein
LYKRDQSELRSVRWLGSTLEDVRQLPADVRRRVGYELARLQTGERPSDSRALHGVGPGAMELRIHLSGEYRVAYAMQGRIEIAVLHVFRKKSQRTPLKDIELIRSRLRQLRLPQGNEER